MTLKYTLKITRITIFTFLQLPAKDILVTFFIHIFHFQTHSYSHENIGELKLFTTKRDFLMSFMLL